MKFNGLHVGLHNISRLSDGQSRSISAENPRGNKGQGAMAIEGTGKEPARGLGMGWKVSPSIIIAPKQSYEIAYIEESGCIEHIWLTTSPDKWRKLVLRIYWDEEESPSVEVPLGDFFCNGWGIPSLVKANPIAVYPAGGFNSYFPMPFRKDAKIIIENRDDESTILYYQVDYLLTDVDEDEAYFHANFRMSSPVRDGIHSIITNIKGKGHYVGTYMAIQVNNNGWWGEGEVKFYIDEDKDFPTICTTGTEDYFGGAWNFEQPKGEYHEYSTLYAGLNQVILPDGLYSANTRFGMYRYHILDPIRFEKELRVTVQDLGWRSKGRYLKQKSNISTVAYWYQAEPHYQYEKLPDDDDLEII